MKRKRPEHVRSTNYIRHIKHAATFLLIAGILFTTVASASAYLNKASKIKVEVGRAHVVSGKIIDIDQDKTHITIRDFTRRLSKYSAPAANPVWRSPAALRLLRVPTGTRRLAPRGQIRLAGTPPYRALPDASPSEFSLSSGVIRQPPSKTVEIQPQTVILWNGSLSSPADLKPGMLARAEFDKIEPSKLMRLKIND